jgi:tRNA 5-methylaminomethyl-2-thiouridine biosynthesis bifunctional protein
VLAAGAETTTLAPCAWLPITAARGQLTMLPATNQRSRLKLAICHEGYLIPEHDGVYCVGASYAPNDLALDVRMGDQRYNLDLLQRHLPHLDLELAPRRKLNNRVSTRATTPDQLPMIGPLPDRDYFLENYADLRHGRRPEGYPSAVYLPGLYMMAGLGSRGLSSALLGAELLACQIAGEPLPLEKDLVDALSPARFLVRELKRR